MAERGGALHAHHKPYGAAERKSWAPRGVCGADRLRSRQGQGWGWPRRALSPLGQCQLLSPACSTCWSFEPETGDCGEFAFILETSGSRAWEGGGWPLWSAERDARGEGPTALSCQGHGKWPVGGPAWPRNSGTEGSLGTRPALTACRSTLPATCQHQLGVGSAPRAWEKGQRPVPARHRAGRKHSRD